MAISSEWVNNGSACKLLPCRTLLGIFLNVLASPLRAVRGSAADIFEILKTWKRLAREYEARYRRQQVCKHFQPSPFSALPAPLPLHGCIAQDLPCKGTNWAFAAARQAEDSQKAQKAVSPLSETEVVRGAAYGAELTERRPAPLAVDEEDAATPEPANKAVRSNGRASAKGKAASSVQVSPSVKEILSSISPCDLSLC